MTTAADIKRWFECGVEIGATHMIVVCDTYDWDDYPSYVKSGEDFWKAYDHYNGKNMQKIMEVYDLSKPWPTKTGLVLDVPPRSPLNGAPKHET